MPPTGKAIHISGYLIYRIADNKIVEHWMLADMPALLQQIGAMPVAAQA
jgi:predicted ester cyclase